MTSCSSSCVFRAALLENRFTRLLGKPPVLVAGMTPTTVGAEFVAAIAQVALTPSHVATWMMTHGVADGVCVQAGYTCELAGGGLPTTAIFRQRSLHVSPLSRFSHTLRVLAAECTS